MNQKFIKESKQKLEQEKNQAEESLKKIAKKDEGVSGDWDTRFPSFNGGESGSGLLETEADELEEYGTNLSLGNALEFRLKNIDSALEKIEKGKYGICEKCGKEIDEKRLEIVPETRFCMKCKI